MQEDGLRWIAFTCAVLHFSFLMSEAPEPRPGRYRHYKGKDYRVLALARHSETEEELVVYQLLYGDFSWWVRPRSLFLETVEIDGQRVPRFAFVAET